MSCPACGSNETHIFDDGEYCRPGDELMICESCGIIFDSIDDVDDDDDRIEP